MEGDSPHTDCRRHGNKSHRKISNSYNGPGDSSVELEMAWCSSKRFTCITRSILPTTLRPDRTVTHNWGRGTRINWRWLAQGQDEFTAEHLPSGAQHCPQNLSQIHSPMGKQAEQAQAWCLGTLCTQPGRRAPCQVCGVAPVTWSTGRGLNTGFATASLGDPGTSPVASELGTQRGPRTMLSAPPNPHPDDFPV